MLTEFATAAISICPCVELAKAGDVLMATLPRRGVVVRAGVDVAPTLNVVKRNRTLRPDRKINVSDGRARAQGQAERGGGIERAREEHRLEGAVGI